MVKTPQIKESSELEGIDNHKQGAGEQMVLLIRYN
jgi:hypothetical protein